MFAEACRNRRSRKQPLVKHVCSVEQVMLTVWRKKVLLPLAFFLVFVAIEGTFLSSTILKVPKVCRRP